AHYRAPKGSVPRAVIARPGPAGVPDHCINSSGDLVAQRLGVDRSDAAAERDALLPQLSTIQRFEPEAGPRPGNLSRVPGLLATDSGLEHHNFGAGAKRQARPGATVLAPRVRALCTRDQYRERTQELCLELYRPGCISDLCIDVARSTQPVGERLLQRKAAPDRSFFVCL